MLIKKCILLILFLGCITHSFSQQFGFNEEEKMNEELSNAMKALSNNDRSNIDDAFGKIAFYYCKCKATPNCTIKRDILYGIIKKYRKQISFYHRYLYLNIMDCLEVAEYSEIQNYLNEHLTEEDEYFYELVGKYQLKKCEPSLTAAADSSFFMELKKKLGSSHHINFRYHNNSFARQAKIHTTLANLGDSLIEQKILSILMIHYQTFDIESPTIENMLSQENFSLEIFKEILGKLYSIESLKVTLDMLDNFQNYGDYVYYEDVSTSPFNYRYINEILLSKLHPIFENQFRKEFLTVKKRFYSSPSGTFKNLTSYGKNYMIELKQQVVEDKLEWSPIYDFRAKKDPKGN